MSSEIPLPRDKITQVYLGSWGDEETQSKTRARINWLADQVEHSIVLDIGCSEGILPILLGRKGIDVIGVDSNPDVIDYAERLLSSEDIETINHVTFKCTNIFNNDLAGDEYDYVIMGEIIEHFAHPEVLINHAISLIKPGGTLLVTTPFGYFPDPDHWYTFTLSKFLDYFRSQGMTPLSLTVEDSYIRFTAKKTVDITNRWEVIDESILSINEESIINDQIVLYNRLNKVRNQQKDLLDSNQSLLAKNTQLEENNKALSNYNSQLHEELDHALLENAQLTDDLQSLMTKYKGMTVRYDLIIHSTTYLMSVEIKNAFNPIGIKTLTLPNTFTKLFVQWVRKKNAANRIITKIKALSGWKFLHPSEVFDEQAQENTFLMSLDLFIKNANKHPEKPVVVISSTTIRMGGLKRLNRPMAFANELAKMDIPVIYIYYRWKARDDKGSDYDGAYLLQFPNTLFHKLASHISASFQNTRKLLLFSIPDINAITEFAEFKLHGWVVGYEVRDDWGEFNTAGVGNWYNPAYEIYLATNADFVTTVSCRLYEKMIAFGAMKESIYVVPNGLNGEFLENAWGIFSQRANGYKGKGIIGYFGHLTEKWFNWELLIKTAMNYPELKFEIIGFGAPKMNNLPSNIQLLGEKTHAEIIEITKNWSMTIIPFKNNDLSRAVDPIKLYEYQALGLPCVSCLMDQIKDYPFTFIYENDADFKKMLDIAMSYHPSKADWEILQNFVQKNTWNNRVIRTLQIANLS